MTDLPPMPADLIAKMKGLRDNYVNASMPFIMNTPPQSRGYQPAYHLDIVNRCPGCGNSHWHVGRFSAECAHCETALPFATISIRNMGEMVS